MDLVGGVYIMHFLFIASSDMQSTLSMVCGLISAAAKKGHEITVFFHMEGVRLLMASRDHVRKYFAPVIPMKVKFLSCRTSAIKFGMESKDDMIEGAEMSSLGELIEIMGRCDRVLFLG
jgi:sulfur relay (sulfurtransferase) complex TusBCD TusD component (DsrE family)